MASEERDDDATNERRDAVRETAKRVNARIRRRKILRRSIITLVIVAVVAAAAWWVWRSVSPELEREVVAPDNVSGDAIDVLSLMPEDERPEQTEEEPFEIDIYLDYLSPDAGVIETSLAPEIYDWLDEGVVTVKYHPVSLLSGGSNDQYSTRAAGAVMCVVSEAPGAFRAFNTELLTHQPSESGTGYDDDELAEMAVSTGADEARECILDRTHASWVAEATDRALDGDLPGTDGERLEEAMVLVDGERYEGALDDAAEFSQYLFTLDSERTYGDTDSE